MDPLKAFTRWFALFTGCFLVIALVSLGLYGRYHLNQPLTLPADEVIFKVPEHSNLSLIASELKANGYMAWPEYLLLWARWQDRTLVQVGEYRIQAGDTPRKLLEMLNNGKVILHHVQLIEGWRFDQIRSVLRSDTRLIDDTAGVDNEQLLAMLGITAGYLEGWFYPDTYTFSRGDKVSEILRRAHQKMQKVLEEEWQSRAVGLPYESPEQALIMASIVEKETGLESERAQIAGVFVRRLQMGMRLQTDPTVIYGIENFDGNITRRHLRDPTPYNTYVIQGLPPTPIASPGRDSIRAALQPAEGDTLYFVSRGDGSHEFSSTFEQHQQAVNRYQLK